MAENAEKQQMDREFALAREIQQRLPPRIRRRDAGLRAADSEHPLRARSPATTSTFACRADGKIYATIADVSRQGQSGRRC